MTKRAAYRVLVMTPSNGAHYRPRCSRFWRSRKLAHCMCMKEKKSRWQMFHGAGESRSTRMLLHAITTSGTLWNTSKRTNLWCSIGSILLQRQREGKGENPDMSDVMDGIAKKARDHARTPMQVTCYPNRLFCHNPSDMTTNQWNSSQNAGFSSGTPWMRVNDDFGEWNAAAQQNDPESVLNFWKKLLKLRKENNLLVRCTFYRRTRW